ncbi:MAG: polysaccharide deacetylase family protein, partial [Oscillospiraceae bacterium]
MFVSVKITRELLVVLSVVLMMVLSIPIASFAVRGAAEPTAAVPSTAVSPVAYLTFDDGPSVHTQSVLDALERNGVKATFFVTAQSPEHLNMLAAESAAGHLVALHSYSHEFKNIYASEADFWADIERLQDVISEQTGSRSNFLRFPGGSSNTAARRCGGSQIMKNLVEQCKQFEYTYYDWNVDTRDALGDVKSADYIAKRAISGALGQKNAVILMHDAGMSA